MNPAEDGLLGAWLCCEEFGFILQEIFLSCAWPLWGRDTFSSSSLEVEAVVVSLSKAKAGDGVLPSRVVRVEPQEAKLHFLQGGGRKAHSGFNVASWNRNSNGLSARPPIFLTLPKPKQL